MSKRLILRFGRSVSLIDTLRKRFGIMKYECYDRSSGGSLGILDFDIFVQGRQITLSQKYFLFSLSTKTR